MVKDFLSFIKLFFISVNWYETFSTENITNKKKIGEKNSKLVILKSKKNVKKMHLEEYFDKYRYKLRRLNKKIYFLVLVKNKKILSSGWIYSGSRWKITEIDSYINLKKIHLLFDFETPKYLRNRGYYTLLLREIQNKFKKKKLAIYSVSHNFSSTKAIEKSGFKFKKRIYKYF